MNNTHVQRQFAPTLTLPRIAREGIGEDRRAQPLFPPPFDGGGLGWGHSVWGHSGWTQTWI